MTCREKIRKIKKERKIKTELLAELSGIPASTLEKFLSGHTSSIKSENLLAIANALEISFDELAGDTDESSKCDFSPEEQELIEMFRQLEESKRKEISETIKKEYNILITKPVNDTVFSVEDEFTRTIPLYDSPVSAGCGNYLDSDGSRSIVLNLNDITERADFAVRVRGDSMIPKYDDGDIVLVEAASDVDEGSVGIFILNGESYIKKLGRNTLISLNPKYSAIPLSSDDEFECKGLVIARIRSSKTQLRQGQ